VQLGHYLARIHEAELTLADGFGTVAAGHGDDAEIAEQCRRLGGQCRGHAEAIEPFLDRYGSAGPEGDDPEARTPLRLHPPGPLALLLDLHDLYLMAAECDLVWTLAGQAAHALHDKELLAVVERCEAEAGKQAKWLSSALKVAAPQALVASD
jgi:hypothetical protein